MFRTGLEPYVQLYVGRFKRYTLENSQTKHKNPSGAGGQAMVLRAVVPCVVRCGPHLVTGTGRVRTELRGGEVRGW